MPLPAVAEVVPLGSSVSGQTLVHPLSSVQVILPPFSDVSMYRVWPWPLTRTVPTPATLLALTVIPGEEDADEAAGWFPPTTGKPALPDWRSRWQRAWRDGGTPPSRLGAVG